MKQDGNPLDEYVRVTHLQNRGINCPYCGSNMGHLGQFRLLNAAEAVARLTGLEVHNTPATKELLQQSEEAWDRIKSKERTKTETKPTEVELLAAGEIEGSKYFQTFVQPSETDRIYCKGMGVKL
jgi:hypothetical protein